MPNAYVAIPLVPEAASLRSNSVRRRWIVDLLPSHSLRYHQQSRPNLLESLPARHAARLSGDLIRSMFQPYDSGSEGRHKAKLITLYGTCLPSYGILWESPFTFYRQGPWSHARWALRTATHAELMARSRNPILPLEWFAVPFIYRVVPVCLSAMGPCPSRAFWPSLHPGQAPRSA